MTDPKQQALTKFAAAPDLTPFDVLMRYATDPPLAEKTLLDAIGEGLPPRARVAELGPGSGWLLEDMLAAFPDAHLHALDMSAAMLTNIREQFGHRVAIVRGDIERLPYRDATFDVIATCWTLYFMNDIDAALEEIKRCVKPGGRVVAATVAADHMHEFDDMVAEAVREALGREREPDIGERFNLQNGEAYMRRHFDQVELREWHGEMRLPDIDTTMILWPGYGPQLQDPEEDARAREAFARRVQSLIERDGEFYLTRHDGAFVARVSRQEFSVRR